MAALALFALSIVLYTYLGYPLVAAALARFARGTPPPKEAYLPTVSVCVAVHNGGKYVEPKIQSLQALDYPNDRIEFLFYSDGSTDDTEQTILRHAATDPRIRLLRGESREGKPTALNALAAASKSELLLMTDIRPPLAHGTVRALAQPFSNPNVGCVSGNLVMQGATGAGAYWRYEKFIRMAEARLGKMVGVTGTIYAIRRRDFPVLPKDLILDDVFVPMQVALHTKKQITFEPAAEAYDEAFDDDREFGRKVRTLAGNYQLFAGTPRLLSPIANPAWFQMVSHKALRLVCPFALAVLFGASVAAALSTDPDLSDNVRAFFALLVLGQLAFYTLSAAGGRAGKLAAVARTFVVMNAAAVLGLWRFARGTQRVTW